MFPGGGAGVGGEESAWKANINQRDPAAVQHSQPLHHVLPTNRIRGNSEARPEMGARVKSAEQLPPLSSILQGSGLALPSHSSNALDLSPHYLALSPGSLKRTSAARLQQEQWDGPQARPQSEPTTQFAYLHSNHSFSSTDASPRSQFSPSDFRKPTSPGYYDPTKYDSLESQQERLRSSSVRWSPKANGRFREYLPPMAADGTFNRSGTQSPNAGEQTFTTVQSRIELESIQRQNDGSISSARSFAQSSNIKTSIGTSTKDTLGPKIWTGAHFLPRFVREAEVPGEGPCYFYDDGTYCKTVIDDEPVNAHWGVTKAGKPRKRLAIACITCREKKIKCDPDYPRCVQCEKFGRVCRFKNA